MALSNRPVEHLPHIVIWLSLCQKIESVVPNFHEFLSETGALAYPDGSLYIEGRRSKSLYAQLAPYRSPGIHDYSKTPPVVNPSLVVRESALFRALRCFVVSDQQFRLWITDEYFQNIGGEQGVVITPTPYMAQSISLGETRPNKLLVRVRFWGGLDKSSRPGFTKAIVAWADSVAKHGVLGEGPCYLYIESFLFSRRWASFSIDVSGSGQHSVNWLTLSILNFAVQQDYVEMIRYGDVQSDNE